jgi:Zn-dependent protease with chaperone function
MVSSHGNELIYQYNSVYGYKRYVIDQSEGIVSEKFYLDNSYSLNYVFVNLFAILFIIDRYYWSIDLPVLFSSSVFFIATGLGCLVYSAIPHIESANNPDFFETDYELSLISPIPYFRGSVLRFELPVYISLIIGLLNLQPLFIPNTNLLVIIVNLGLIVALVMLSRTTVSDRTTAKMILLLSPSSIPISTVLANIILYTQIGSYLRPEDIIYELYSDWQALDPIVGILDTLTPPPLATSLIMSLITLAGLIMFFPTLWRKVVEADSSIPHPDLVGQTKPINHSFLFFHSIILLLVIYIPFSYNIHPIVEISSRVDLAILYLPGVLLAVVYVCYRTYQVLLVRQYISKLTKYDLKEVPSKDNISVVFSHMPDVTAFSSNLLGRQPMIFLNKDIHDDFTYEEIKCIYYHEVFHLNQGELKSQRYVNLPILGPIFFFVLIDPEDVYREEFRADEYAAEKVDEQTVISALTKSKQTRNTLQNQIKKDKKIHVIRDFFTLTTSIPLLKFYRPTREQRIQNLKTEKQSTH